MKRVAVIGCCGAGKSTFARELQDIFGLPVFHLDRLLWEPNWKQADMEIFRERCREIYPQDEWIVDGNYSSTMKERFDRADLIVFLDYSTPLCLWRVIQRTISGYGRNRPDVGDGCIERFDLPFLRYVIDFRRKRRDNIIAILDQYSADRILQPRKPEEAALMLSRLRAGK
ncbi:MAG: topology modulation protein [Akkermansiaceae bacterium]|nr:topology modulation protein [Akkermansiaceae bacterium]